MLLFIQTCILHTYTHTRTVSFLPLSTTPSIDVIIAVDTRILKITASTRLTFAHSSSHSRV